MQILWLGHGSFRYVIGGKVLLVDPWLTGNPMLPAGKHGEAIEGATHILTMSLMCFHWPDSSRYPLSASMIL